MEFKVIALFAGVLAYWTYCIFWGVKGYRVSKTAADYFIAGRALPLWVFVLAATATSFSGWTFVGHPGSIYAGGLPYAFASFYAITIPFSGLLFLKRQWLLGKHFSYITPGEMYSQYFNGEGIRFLTLIVAACFSVPYLAVQLMASGFLFEVLTGGLIPRFAGALLLSTVVVFYVAAGGLRSVAWVDCLQCVLLMLGITVLGITTLNALGGWNLFSEGLRSLPENFLEVPGIMQFTSQGGPWTGMMILTYMFALMGIQASPAFSMWAFSNRDPRPFPIQQVWASSLLIGGILFLFSTIQGLGGRLLGYELPTTDALVPFLMKDLMGTPLMVFTAIAALAAMQSTGAAYMSTASGMFTRDLYVRYINPKATEGQQLWFGRMLVILVAVAAFIISAFATDAIVLLGGLAVAYGFQMYPALIATCYWHRLTRQGVTWGLFFGLLAVTVTYVIEGFRYPLTVHSAGWGILVNMLVALAVSYWGPQPSPEERRRRKEHHGFLRSTVQLPPEKRSLARVMWVVTPIWFLFAIGPGVVLGSDAGVFVAGFPLLWLWQIVWWILGVAMMYVLAYKLEFSTMPRSLVREVASPQPAVARK